MITLIISLIMALISYFTAKKSGASNTTAAMVGAAAGAGTYYVATETEWGQNVVSSLSGSETVAKNASGEALQNANGSVAVIPAGATVYKDADGNPIRDADGDIQYIPSGSSVVSGVSTNSSGIVKTTGDVLKSWGAPGTAAVIGTAALATSSDTSKYLIYGGIALAAILIMK